MSLSAATREGPCPDNQPSRLLRHLVGTLWDPPPEPETHTAQGRGRRLRERSALKTSGDKREGSQSDGGSQRRNTTTSSSSDGGMASAASLRSMEASLRFQLPIPSLLNFSHLPQQDFIDDSFATGRGPMYRFVLHLVCTLIIIPPPGLIPHSVMFQDLDYDLGRCCGPANLAHC